MPFRAGGRWFSNGHEIPVKGAGFPERIAAIVELQGATILNALARIERGYRAAEHVRCDTQPAGAGLQLEMNPRAGTQRARALDEGAARAQIDQGHGVARTQNGLGAGNHRLAKTCVGSTVC
jgi:hypothetical protein